MNRVKLRVFAMPLTALLALAGCEKVEDEDRGTINAATGVSDPWGHHAGACAPSGCAPEPGQRGGPRTGANIYHPKYLGLIHVKFEAGNSPEDPGEIVAKHALYDLAKCKKKIANGLAHEVILRDYEKKNDWPKYGTDAKACEKIELGTGENMKGIRYFGQTDIYIDVDGLKSKFDPVHPITFTKYSQGDFTEKMTKNYSFYEAKPVKNSIQEDDLIYIKNYLGHKKWLRRWKVLKKVDDLKHPKDMKKYSMNIHLQSGSGKIPIIIDPDTGNGNDG